jgi:dipeptidyl aminopeptidase/acylaminoacyl peptidase
MAGYRTESMGARRETGARPPGSGGSTPAPGWWPSPWSAAAVATGKVSRSGLQAEGEAVYWLESRPTEGGRHVVVRARAGRARDDISPAGVSVRTRVHEYGGAAATVHGNDLFYVELESQQWFRVPVDGADGAADPVGLTRREMEGEGAGRYADGRVTASGRWLACVVEQHLGDGAVRHRLAAVAVDGSERVVNLALGADFVAAPRPSPDGRLLAWVSWDHPSMPWDSSELWMAEVEESETTFSVVAPRLVAGGGGVSVGQPRWCDDGSLLFVDDRTGWWLPYRLDPDTPAWPPTPLTDLEAEFHAPDWTLGQATMAELADGSLVCRARVAGRDQLVRLRPSDRPGEGPWGTEVVEQPCVSLSGVAAGPGAVGTVYVLGSTPTESNGVFEIGLEGRPATGRISAAPDRVSSAGDTSVGRPFAATTPAGPVPGLLFAPTNAWMRRGDQPEAPPVVVFCHGGPTASVEPGFDPIIQFFTSRGLAVAAVDYRGSSGHGRAYRQRLRGLWGEADVEDCVEYALALERAGLVDGSRMAIRGTSAGGLTALGALVRADCFAGAAAWYGVTDLEALAADTHDFESRYVDSLVGPWPAAAATYRDRSPIHHPDRVSGRVLLLQGTDDPVVPADQSERFAAELAAHSVVCRLVLFEGEAHGFRRAETVEAALTAELDFYRDLFVAGSAPGSPDTAG